MRRGASGRGWGVGLASMHRVPSDPLWRSTVSVTSDPAAFVFA